MTAIEHREELHRAVLISLVVWVAASAICLGFNHQNIEALTRPVHLALSHWQSSLGQNGVVTSPIDGLPIPSRWRQQPG
jgi:Sec-independent protein secretion pathway component TatC